MGRCGATFRWFAMQHVASSCNTLHRSACAFAFPSFCWCPQLSARVQGNAGYSRSLVPLAVDAIDPIACAATNRSLPRAGALLQHTTVWVRVVATYDGFGGLPQPIVRLRGDGSFGLALMRVGAPVAGTRPTTSANTSACKCATNHRRPCSGLSRAEGSMQHATSAFSGRSLGAPTVPWDIPCRCGILWDR
jgi:hypothetical protein